MRLDEAAQHIGDDVIYHLGYRGPEHGVIASVRGEFVFVQYDGDTTPKATNPYLLEFT